MLLQGSSEFYVNNKQSNMPDGQSTETAGGHLFISAAPVSFASVNGYVLERPHVFSSAAFISAV